MFNNQIVHLPPPDFRALSLWPNPFSSFCWTDFGSVVVVPVAFTSDHIETLFELDEEYVKEANEVD